MKKVESEFEEKQRLRIRDRDKYDRQYETIMSIIGFLLFAYIGYKLG